MTELHERHPDHPEPPPAASPGGIDPLAAALVAALHERIRALVAEAVDRALAPEPPPR